MKGIESMPIKILATLIIIAAVIGVSVWQINYFLGFNEKAKFKEDLANLYQTIKTTQSFGDQGSFTTVWVNVPAGSYFTISLDSDEMSENYNGDSETFKLTADVVGIKKDADPISTSGEVKFDPGQYTMRLYYGDAPANPKEWTIYFK